MRYRKGYDLMPPDPYNGQLARAHCKHDKILIPSWIVEARWNLSARHMSPYRED
ncbi:MAG: hypothetical protein LAO55_17350 [Acidobacteriia bacterium]|nr:hypothetical protein [Terriglobia bacterium]